MEVANGVACLASHYFDLGVPTTTRRSGRRRVLVTCARVESSEEGGHYLRPMELEREILSGLLLATQCLIRLSFFAKERYARILSFGNYHRPVFRNIDSSPAKENRPNDMVKALYIPPDILTRIQA